MPSSATTRCISIIASRTTPTRRRRSPDCPGELHDWGDIIGELGGAERVRVASRLSELLQRLAEHGMLAWWGHSLGSAGRRPGRCRTASRLSRCAGWHRTGSSSRPTCRTFTTSCGGADGRRSGSRPCGTTQISTPRVTGGNGGGRRTITRAKAPRNRAAILRGHEDYQNRWAITSDTHSVWQRSAAKSVCDIPNPAETASLTPLPCASRAEDQPRRGSAIDCQRHSLPISTTN